MSINLKKRILSSMFLLCCLFFVFKIGKFFFIFLLLALAIISVYELNKLLDKFYSKLIGAVFLFTSFYTVYEIKFNNINQYLFFLTLSICIFTDMGGFIFGKLFKGPKLTTISPNKTISGAIGGLVLSIFFVYLFTIFILEKEFYYQLLILTFLLSIVCQIGDLLISYFKRKSNIKDTGNLIPGHGGLLDRIDGMIFAFPFCFFLSKINFI
ncbi:phosphatidate cytidylyltransferase [Candidatus Pelagibacter sp.]|jgi:phosphatidate cytidylyltransferase|nr:phosphatidate cytidylyltransferase [Candidatus Pelagibacter sp.]